MGGDDSSSTKRRAGKNQPEKGSQVAALDQCLPKSVEELANLPIELVERAIVYAKTEPGLQAYQVSRRGAQAISRRRMANTRAAHRQIGITGRDRPIDGETYTSGTYGDLFRLGSDTNGLKIALSSTTMARGAPRTGVLAPSPEETHTQEHFTDTNRTIPKVGHPVIMYRQSTR